MKGLLDAADITASCILDQVRVVHPFDDAKGLHVTSLTLS